MSNDSEKRYSFWKDAIEPKWYICEGREDGKERVTLSVCYSLEFAALICNALNAQEEPKGITEANEILESLYSRLDCCKEDSIISDVRKTIRQAISAQPKGITISPDLHRELKAACSSVGWEVLYSRLCEAALPELDNCEVCKGAKGGVRGNENVIDGVVTCDYCHAQALQGKPQ